MRGFVYVEGMTDDYNLTGESDYVYFKQLPITTDYSVSGSTTPYAFPNLIIIVR